MLTAAGVGAYDAARWDNFAVAEVGASAALAGLLVVACSINISRILDMPPVVARLAASLALFTGVLMAGTVLLVPGQDRRLVGTELAVIGLAVAAFVLRNHGIHDGNPQYRRYAVLVAALAATAALLVVTAGVLCAIAVGGGLYWLFPGILLAFSIGLVNSWIALVEILR